MNPNQGVRQQNVHDQPMNLPVRPTNSNGKKVNGRQWKKIKNRYEQAKAARGIQPGMEISAHEGETSRGYSGLLKRAALLGLFLAPAILKSIGAFELGSKSVVQTPFNQCAATIKPENCQFLKNAIGWKNQADFENWKICKETETETFKDCDSFLDWEDGILSWDRNLFEGIEECQDLYVDCLPFTYHGPVNDVWKPLINDMPAMISKRTEGREEYPKLECPGENKKALTRPVIPESELLRRFTEGLKESTKELFKEATKFGSEGWSKLDNKYCYIGKKSWDEITSEDIKWMHKKKWDTEYFNNFKQRCERESLKHRFLPRP